VPFLNTTSASAVATGTGLPTSLVVPGGILLDPATAITCPANGSGGDVVDPWISVVYDIVPI
jgi:hypothetical protein